MYRYPYVLDLEMHCIKIGNRFPNVLRYEMVRFQCDGKRMKEKRCFSGFLVEMSVFFCKNLGTRYVVLGVLRVDCKMEVVCFLVHGKSMVRWARIWISIKKN